MPLFFACFAYLNSWKRSNKTIQKLFFQRKNRNNFANLKRRHHGITKTFLASKQYLLEAEILFRLCNRKRRNASIFFEEREMDEKSNSNQYCNLLKRMGVHLVGGEKRRYMKAKRGKKKEGKLQDREQSFEWVSWNHDAWKQNYFWLALK